MTQKTTKKPTKMQPAKRGKKTASVPSAQAAKQPEQPAYRSFRLSKRVKYAVPKLPGTLRLVRSALNHIRSYKRVWFGVIGVFAAVQVVLVQGVLGGSIGEFTEAINALYEDVSGGAMSLAVLSYVVSTTGQATTESGGVYQVILVLLTSLALIWMLRQTMADTKVGVKDAFYKGMYPLVPFVLVLLVIGLQLFPLLFGAWLYQITVSAGLAVTLLEQAFWVLVAGFFMLLTFYMLCSSVFATYIVTLPDMTPLRALRSARDLVRHRRLSVVWRVFAFVLLLIVVGSIVLVPVILVAPVIATWVFYILGVLGIGLFHTYMYGLYRELLQDA